MYNEIASLLNKWDSSSVIKTGAFLSDGFKLDKSFHYYSPKLMPHQIYYFEDEVSKKVEVYKLKEYLMKTVYVESEIVNNAINEIRNLQTENISTEYISALYKIYTDEGYHIVMVLQLIRQLDQLFGLEELIAMPESVGRILHRISSPCDIPKEVKTIVSAIITETLITGTLTQAQDGLIAKPVNDLLKEHAMDEAVHHAFFTRFGNLYLGSLSKDVVNEIGNFVAHTIYDFLSPETLLLNKYIKELSGEYLINKSNFNEYYDVALSCQDMLRSARATLKIFRNNGVEVEEKLKLIIEAEAKVIYETLD